MAKAVANIICNAVQYSGDGERVVVSLEQTHHAQEEEGLSVLKRLYSLRYWTQGLSSMKRSDPGYLILSFGWSNPAAVQLAEAVWGCIS